MAAADLELCYMTATEAIAKFKSKKLSPVELMKAVIARCETVNPKVNALPFTYFDRALKQAKQAEAKYARKDGRLRPLEGVPCAIKDWHSVKDEITTYGSRVYKGFRPTQTAPTVERLLAAGAIMHCRTTTPEFAHSGATHSPLWGITRNPWNLAYNAGGSSGGAGAAVASGMTPLADGTDGGGSIRIPASACGIFGYKPPFGRNPLDREHPMETILHYGPMTRSVADGALMQNVTSGPHDDDMCSLRDKLVLPLKAGASLKGWKIAFTMDFGYVEVDHEVQKNTHAALKVFKSLGAKVEEVELGWTFDTMKTWQSYWEGIFYGLAGDLLPNKKNELDPFVVKLIEAGAKQDAGSFYMLNQKRAANYAKLSPILSKYDVMLCPTLAIPAPKANHQNDATDFTINGKSLPAYVSWLMTYPFNLVSQCPVATVPTGFCGKTGVPTGLQIVARSYDDQRVFRAAYAYEKANPWRGKRPGV